MSGSGPVKAGAVREDGAVFRSRSYGREIWLSPKAFHRARVSQANCAARRRAKASVLPFDIDAEYLSAIFPEDGKCPALGINLVWGGGGGTSNSPSLDRVVPERGYVRGNVIWVSNLANAIKSCATVEQIGAVHSFYKDLQ